MYRLQGRTVGVQATHPFHKWGDERTTEGSGTQGADASRRFISHWPVREQA
jgi:hypothetical protein